MFVNIFQIVVPRIADPWYANFENQLAGCVQLPAQGDGLQVGQALVGAVQQELGDARVPSQDLGVRVQDRQAVRDVPEPVCGVQVQRQGSAQLLREGVVRLEPEDPQFLGKNLANVVQKEIKSTSRDLTLSEKVLLHKDSILLGLNFEEELTVSSLPFEVKVPEEVVHVDAFVHPSELSASTSALSGVFKKLFEVKRKSLFAFPSKTDSASAFVASSASVMSRTSVPSTCLKDRVSSPPSPTSVSASPTVRTSVLSTNSVPVLEKDGILGLAGASLSLEELGKRSKALISDFVFNSVAPGTLKIYKYTWELFKSFGKISGVNVEKFEFDFLFICQFFIYRLQSTSSLSSILSARSSISFYWKLHSSLPCPTESNYVSLFIKGISRKFKEIPNKAYAISWAELESIFKFVVGDSELENLSFVDLRFITFLLTSYSSFGRYEEVANLKIEDIYSEDEGFVLTFKKGKSYQYGESHIGVLSNLPRLKFNPAKIFSLYLDQVALMHAKSNTKSDFLFPSIRKSVSVLHTLDKPVSYSNLLKKFKFCVKECKIKVGLSKVGLHSLRRGGVTYAVRAGAPHPVVAKCMRVKGEAMVGYYATLTSKELRSASNLAFN